jgi:aromatic-amino-acid transaminase
VRDLELELVTFAHATDDGAANLDALKDALADARDGDVVLLHGCCHNPTGIDYTPAQWDEIAALLAENPALPVIDLAYQGLGQGMDEDAYGARAVVDAVPEALIAYSCDKNFGLYRDRVGAFYTLAKDAGDIGRILSNGHALARAAWSMPPDHGAAAVRLILSDPKLTTNWLDELEQMRTRIRQVRARLAEAGRIGSIDLAPLGEQNGMFATLPLGKAQIEALRDEHGIYMAGSGRINVAGLTTDNIGKFTAALAAVAAETV